MVVSVQTYGASTSHLSHRHQRYKASIRAPKVKKSSIKHGGIQSQEQNVVKILNLTTEIARQIQTPCAASSESGSDASQYWSTSEQCMMALLLPFTPPNAFNTIIYSLEHWWRDYLRPCIQHIIVLRLQVQVPARCADSEQCVCCGGVGACSFTSVHGLEMPVGECPCIARGACPFLCPWSAWCFVYCASAHVQQICSFPGTSWFAFNCPLAT